MLFGNTCITDSLSNEPVIIGHARRYQRGTNVVVLEPDVARVFSDAATVNDSLRALAGIIRRQKAVAK